MNGSETPLRNLLENLVDDQGLHERWLATLSYLENQGAKKIFGHQPSEDLPLDLLQHAAEEARHAWFFKKLLTKIGGDGSRKYPLLGGNAGRRYLHRLDMGICRWLSVDLGLEGRDLKRGSYLLTTYAIEVRAASLYPLYAEVLKERQIKISLASVIVEEDRHLAQITAEIEAWQAIAPLKTKAQQLEAALYARFLKATAADIGMKAFQMEPVAAG